MRTAALVLGFLVWATAQVAAGDAITVEIVDYGIYTAEVTTPGGGPPSDLRPNLLTNICHVATTQIVPARDHLHFGFRYRVDGPPLGSPVDIRRVIVWPDHTKPLGTPVAYMKNERVEKLRIGQTWYAGWTNMRARPGIWTFQILHVGRKLAEMSFTVVEKGEAPVRPDGDSACFQISSREGEMRWHSI